MKKHVLPLLVIFAILSGSCKSNRNGVKTVNEHASTEQPAPRKLRLVSPADKTYIDPSVPVNVELEELSTGPGIDSIQIQAGGRLLKTMHGTELNSQVDFRDFNPGELRLSVKAYFSDQSVESHTARIRVLSGIEPALYRFTVHKTYPHDITAYTQGLEYSDGYLYEGTGNYGGSSLRKVVLETGEIVKFRELSSEFFGEGITRLNGKIYQITYQEQVGFVYDEKSFEPLRKIFYQNKEGWGLCNDGKNILMSDGSHVIYFMDSIYFGVERKIEVYDNGKEVNMLNELELINGTLYANRYTTNEIVMIDPATGRATGKIDMTGLLDPADRHPKIDYLNGIAYDREKDRIFVTGKNWPKVYEVVFVEKE